MKPMTLWPACLLLAFVPDLIQANAPAHDDLASQQMSVRELMRLDTALALEQARASLHWQRAEHGQPESGSLLAQSGALRLLAIYGVGKKLLAEVMIGEQTYVYMRGQPWAVGVKAGPATYRLLGISGSCVHLDRAGEGHTLCLHPGPWGTK